MITLTDIDVIQLLRKNQLDADTLQEKVVDRKSTRLNSSHA